MTSDFNNTAAKQMVQGLLLDMINDNKTLIIWPSGYNPDLSSSHNADISLEKRKALEKGALLVAGYDSRIQIAHIKSSLCTDTFNSCLMAPYIVQVPFVPGAINNTENDIASGAKFSAAIVTGIAAQVLQKFPWMNSDILRQTLLSTAQRKNLYHMVYGIGMPSTYRGYSASLHGWGLVNLVAALKGPSLFDSRLNLDKNNVVVNVDDDSGSTYTFSHDIKGDSGLDKTGKGILELSGKNQYQGTTSVKEGVLKITGSLINAPKYHITVHRGATLELAGTVSSSIIVKGGGRLVLKDGAEIKKNLIVESEGMLDRKGQAFGKSTVDGNIFADKENFLKNNNGCLKARRLVIFHRNNESFSRPHNNFHEFGSSPKDEGSNIHNGFFGRYLKNMDAPL